MSTDQKTCGYLTAFGEWVCDAPAGHTPDQHYFIKVERSAS